MKIQGPTVIPRSPAAEHSATASAPTARHAPVNPLIDQLNPWIPLDRGPKPGHVNTDKLPEGSFELGGRAPKPGARFSSIHQAAQAVQQLVGSQSVSRGQEFGGILFETPNQTFTFSRPVTGQAQQLDFNHALPVDENGEHIIPAGLKPVGMYHSHPQSADVSGNSSAEHAVLVNSFSVGDIAVGLKTKLDQYLICPDGSLLKFTPPPIADEQIEPFLAALQQASPSALVQALAHFGTLEVVTPGLVWPKAGVVDSTWTLPEIPTPPSN